MTKSPKIDLMKILWIVNEFFPAVSKKLNQPISLYGGWTFGLAEKLKDFKNLDLHVATVAKNFQLNDYHVEGITYHILESKVNKTKYDKSLETQWSKLTDVLKPDVVHIHGTEFAHGLALMRVRPNLNYLVSIQGLVSVYANYYYAGISKKDILRYATFRDWVRWDTLIHGKKNYIARGKNEREYIQRTQAVMGRTDWDKAHTKAINPSVNYYFGNETLRNEFYTDETWNVANLKKQTIFLSQASSPVKGLHQVIKAVALLKDKFPNLSVEIAGGNILDRSSMEKRIKFTGFANYIYNLAKKNDVLSRFKFIGSLTADQMRNQYLSSSIFVCPSSIENSPNSIGEAQLLGVPVISSYVGGIQNMIEHNQTGFLYRFEEVELLAYLISDLLTNPNKARNVGLNGVSVAKTRHNGKINREQLISAYSVMIENDNINIKRNG